MQLLKKQTFRRLWTIEVRGDDRFHQVEITNHMGLWGEIIRAVPLSTVDGLIAESKALILDNINNPPRTAYSQSKQ